ncbi:hypothetical protein FUAX_15070 [Fulvitalea axinellae]|uniref:Uncharacterized protein n=1 Tax=Fulvitalea axinellae TaxID=1182444 RepID=A0AAU9D9W2_9BACT|nr:hypothetical protein FUAX_15070 [Fulvitalea axinellae]
MINSFDTNFIAIFIALFFNRLNEENIPENRVDNLFC